MVDNKSFKRYKHYVENLAILLIVLSGISNIVLSLPYRFKILSALELYYHLNAESIMIHGTVSTIAGFILIVLSYRLYKRMRMAWTIMVGILPVSLILHILKFHDYLNVFTLAESFVIVILLLGYKDFNRESNPVNLKWGIVMASVSLFLVLLNTAIGLLLLKNHFRYIADFEDSLLHSLRLLFYMDASVIETKTKLGMLYIRSAIVLNWVSIISAIVLVLKPLMYQPIISLRDREKVRNYLNQYGNNPISYVAVEEDKKYFFSTGVEGVIAYVIVGGVAVCAGDPICKKEDTVILLSEFVAHCKQHDLDICFCQTMGELLDHFKVMGFGIVKYGEEAMFDLSSHNISGGKAAKLRQAINNANRMGIEVFEYKPLEERDKQLENEIAEVSRSWLSFKKSSELSFMLGGIGLSNPMDRRYFVAVDPQKTVQGFAVFVPFNKKKGYYADVTRRREEAPLGVMEKIIMTAFDTMKNESLEWGSLGLAPLANIRGDDEGTSIVGLVLAFIYENLNNFYGFKTLHQYKKKYAPTLWESRFLAYYPNVFTPKIAYSIIKAQNPKGVTDYLLTQIRQIFTK